MHQAAGCCARAVSAGKSEAPQAGTETFRKDELAGRLLLCNGPVRSSVTAPTCRPEERLCTVALASAGVLHTESRAVVAWPRHPVGISVWCRLANDAASVCVMPPHSSRSKYWHRAFIACVRALLAAVEAQDDGSEQTTQETELPSRALVVEVAEGGPVGSMARPHLRPAARPSPAASRPPTKGRQASQQRMLTTAALQSSGPPRRARRRPSPLCTRGRYLCCSGPS